ncbi:MAG: cysteine--tRNA ligase, partial [Rikenellaceae bacterium]
EDLATLKKDILFIVEDLLGLKDEGDNGNKEIVSGLVEMLLNMRQEAKDNKDWSTSDKIRDKMAALGVKVKDRKDGFDWEV